MPWEGVVLTLITYSSWFRSCEKGHQFEQALGVFRLNFGKQQPGVPFNAITFNALIARACLATAN